MSKSHGRRRQEIKYRMWWQQGGHCHWCDRRVFLEIVGQPLPPETATLDHVFTKNDPRREHPPKGSIAHVVACHGCNNERGSMPYDDFLKLKRPEWA